MVLPTIRALVVDDEEGIRCLLKIALARHGIQSDCASNGSEALARLQTKRYDLVVTDLRMPQGHGHSLCTALLARVDRPVIVVLTGVIEPRLADDLKARGVDKICFKPVNFRDFSNEVYSLVLERLQSLRTAAQAASGAAQVPSAPAPVKEIAAPVRPRSVAVESSTDSVKTPDERSSDRQLVAVLRKTAAQSLLLADKLREPGIEVVDLENPDALRRFLQTKPVNLLVIDNEMDGFLTGLEIICKLRAGSIRVPVLLVDSNERLLAEEACPPGLVTLVNSAANNDEIAETARRVLNRQPDEQEMIPERARSLAESQGELPLLSHLILQLLQYLEMPPVEVPVKDLCQGIALDPKAAAVLLKSVNASTNGLVREISNVPDAVRVLGVRPTIGRILNAAVTDGIGSLSNGLPADIQIWHTRRGMLIASTASTFAKELEDASDETAFLIGILQDVGILCMLRTHPQEYRAVLSRWRTVGHLKLGAIEQSALGCTHAEVSAAMMERWQLPRSLIVPVLCHLESATNAARFGIDTGVHRVTTIAEALVDLTDAPHPYRRHVLNSMLAPYGVDKRSACLRSLASATARASEAFQLTTVPLPSAADLEAMVSAALSEDLSTDDAAPLSSEGASLAETLDGNP